MEKPDRSAIRKRVLWQPHIDGAASTDNPYPGRAETKKLTSLTYRMQRDAETDRAELLAELDRLDPSLDCSTREKLFRSVDRILEALTLHDSSGLDRLRELLDAVDPPLKQRRRLRSELRAMHARKRRSRLTAEQTQKIVSPWNTVQDSQRLMFSLYDTPIKLVDTVYALVQQYHTLPRFCTVLEPSAGTGAMVDGYIRNIGAYPTRLKMLDVLRENVTYLRRKYRRISTVTDLNVQETDFLDYQNSERFDLVIGCPPCASIAAPYAPIRHLLHAYSFVETGGVLAFVIPGTTDREPKSLQRRMDAILEKSVVVPLYEHNHLRQPLCLVIAKR